MNAVRKSDLAAAKAQSSVSEVDPYWSALMEDRDLVKRAAAHIRSVCARSAGRLDEIGAYILHEFCSDDSGIYYETCPDRHASIQALMSKCGTEELPVSAMFLRRALSIAALAHEMNLLRMTIRTVIEEAEKKPPRRPRLELVRHRRTAPEPPPLARRIVESSTNLILRIA